MFGKKVGEGWCLVAEKVGRLGALLLSFALVLHLKA